MKRMQSPEQNRKGQYEEQDVPERLVERFLAKGWKVIGKRKTLEIEDQPSEENKTIKNRPRKR